jgi:hypothetical protein
MKKNQYFSIIKASEEHISLAEEICKAFEEAAKVRGTGIAKRSEEYIVKKIQEGKAIIAISNRGKFAGFCYIETWEHGKYVANSGLIVVPEFRELGLAKKIKQAVFRLSRETYPNAKIFSITTSPAVLKMNSDLGFRPVGFADLTSDDEFWSGCQSCSNYDILVRTKRKLCLCTGLLYNPEKKIKAKQKEKSNEKAKSRISL